MVIHTPRRKFSEKPDYKGQRDVDAAHRVNKIKTILWALGPGAFMGVVIGGYLGHPILGLFGGMAFLYVTVMGLSGGAGKAMGSIYMPSGRGTRKKEYSRAEALAVNGAYEDAVAAYQAEILEDAEDPEPYLRIARIFRDQLKDHDQALAWFKRAMGEAGLSGGQEIRTRREVAEIYLHHKREPRRAAPELARLVESYPGTPDGQWARKMLADIKDDMAAELKEGGERE